MRTGPGVATLASMLLAVALTAGPAAASAAHPAAEPTSPCRGGSPPASTTVPPLELQPALFSVCRATSPPGPPPAGTPVEEWTKQIDEEFGFLSLDEAADLLGQPGHAMPSDQRRFLVTLMAQARDGTGAGILDPRFSSMLDALAVGPDCRQYIAGRIDGLAAGRAATPEDVSRIVHEELADPDATTTGCFAVSLSCRPAPLEGGGGRVDISAEFVVTRGGLERLRRAIDPHSWKPCNFGFFEESCKIVDEPACASKSLCDEDGRCSSPSSCAPSCDQAAKIGDWDGKLHEHYSLKTGRIRINKIRNILDVDWGAQDLKNGYGYAIAQSILHDVTGDLQPPAPCGIDLDDGFVAIEPLGGSRYRFASSKSMHFCGTSADRLYNAVAHVFLCAMTAAVPTNVCCEYR